MADSNDLGLKISKPGYDVHNAGDTDLIFSSSWPALPIAFKGFSQGSIDHGLGFPPFAVVFQQDTNGNFINPIAIDGSFGRNVCDVDQYKVYADGYVVAYNIDLSKNQTYPTFSPPSVQGGSDPDFGIKISKEGRDINSNDLRDFIIHSRAQSPLIATVMTQDSPTGVDRSYPGPGFVLTTLTYKSDLNYASWVFGFTQNSSGRFHYAPYYQQAYPKTQTDGITTVLQTINAGGTQDIGGTILVLRDPFFAATDVRAQY